MATITASDVNINIKSFIGATNSTASIYCPPPAVVATTSTLNGVVLTAPIANFGVLRIDTPQTFTSVPKFESDIQQLILYNDGGANLTLQSFNFTFTLATGRIIAPRFYGTVARSLISGTDVTLLAGTTASFGISYIALTPGDYVNNLIFYSTAQNPEYQVDTYQHVDDSVSILQSTTTFITNTTILGQPNSIDVSFTKRLNGVTYTGTNLTLSASVVGDPGWTVTPGAFNTLTILWDPDQVNNNTGTYLSTVTVVVYDGGQSIGTKTVTNISNVDIDYTQYGNLASWVSPASSYNSIIGVSLDIINGQQVLTIGVGMGGDTAPDYASGGYKLATTYNLGFRARTVIPKFPYWANVWSFVLNQNAYTYYSGSQDSSGLYNYVRKTTTGYDYEKYFGYEQSPGYQSMFIVRHDGVGTVRVYLNNLREYHYNDQFNITLRNLTRAFYYYSPSDNIGRYYQLNLGPIDNGTRTLLFTGFDTLTAVIPNGVTTDSSSWVFDNTSPVSDFYQLTSTTTNGYARGPGKCTFEFTFNSTNYFAQNPGGHFAVVVRCNTDAIANGYVQGQGMIIGNVSGTATPATLPLGVPFAPNPAAPSTQIESFWAGVAVAPNSSLYYGNTLLANTNGVNPVLIDGVEYKFTVINQIAADGKSYTAYKIMQGTTVVYDQPLIYDYNIWYDHRKSGIVIAHVFENATASAWSVTIGSKVITWEPINSVAASLTYVVTTATSIVTLPNNIL